MDVILKKYNAAAVFVGENYRFGFMAEGDVERLRDICGEFNIGVFVVPYVLERDKVVSSSAIRRFVEKGEVEKARDYMSRPFSLSGEVMHGNGVGRKHGFPTANIRIPQEQIVPKDGVYATRINVDGKIYQGLTNLGTKPTVKIDKRNIETYIMDFDGDLYGKKIEIEFLKRIRDTKKFESLGALKKQIEEDKKSI